MDFISITRIWEQLLFNIRWLIYYLWWSIANWNSHFSFFASYERSECFIFGVKRKMLHSGMKWSCFIVRRFLWSILRQCRKIWSAAYAAWSGTACHEAKPDGLIPPFFDKKMAAGIFIFPTILNRIFRRKTQNFAVKWNSENRFTFIKKNSEYTAVAGSVSRPHRLSQSKPCRFFDKVSTMQLDFPHVRCIFVLK